MFLGVSSTFKRGPVSSIRGGILKSSLLFSFSSFRVWLNEDVSRTTKANTHLVEKNRKKKRENTNERAKNSIKKKQKRKSKRKEHTHIVISAFWMRTCNWERISDSWRRQRPGALKRKKKKHAFFQLRCNASCAYGSCSWKKKKKKALDSMLLFFF